jgi:hypothetical protein
MDGRIGRLGRVDVGRVTTDASQIQPIAGCAGSHLSELRKA